MRRHMSSEADTTRHGRSWLFLGALLIAAAVVAAVTGIAVTIAFGTYPVIVFLAYGALAAGFLILAIRCDARWRGSLPADAAGTTARRGNARLIWFGCAWLLLPTVLLLALVSGVLGRAAPTATRPADRRLLVGARHSGSSNKTPRLHGS
jgi:peptidoglycan/LPS O-acetylase OafA/YrhL